MSIELMYSLHDVKALNYSPPFLASNHNIAKRMVSELVADLNTTVGRHPSDYKLYFVGRFLTDTGQIAPNDILEHVVDCVALTPRPSRVQPDFKFAAERDVIQPNGADHG